MGIRHVACAVAFVLAVAGCGDDDGTATLDADEQKAAQALSIEFQGESPSDFARDAGVCMGKRLVDGLGTDRLVAGGLLDDDLTVNENRKGIQDREVAEGYADAVLACQDVRGEIESRREEYPKATNKDIDAYVACVEGIGDELLREAVVDAAMRTQTSATKQYAAKSRACTKQLGPAA